MPWSDGFGTGDVGRLEGTEGAYLSALYQRLAARRGKQRAIIAVAHSIMKSIFYMDTEFPVFGRLFLQLCGVSREYVEADPLVRSYA